MKLDDLTARGRTHCSGKLRRQAHRPKTAFCLACYNYINTTTGTVTDTVPITKEPRDNLGELLQQRRLGCCEDIPLEALDIHLS